MSKGGVAIPANMFFASLSYKMNRFHIGLNGSILSDKLSNTSQYGVQAGVTLEGKSNIYLNSSLSQETEKAVSRTVFSQAVGAQLVKTLWGEANVTLGNLNNYNDYNALYVYNSVDPTLFRTGLTLFWYLGKRVTFSANYTYDTKQIELNQNKYIQQSFLGGIRWKL
jgi:hypothetical protein